MFSFQQTDEGYQIPSSISFQQPAPAPNPQDLIVDLHHDDVAMEATTNPSFVKPRKRVGGQSPSKPNSGDSQLDEHAHRKLVHREIERQRRQEMAKLYASLRGHLPLEFIKGKRSTSDHMHQAVNYIEHLQENIKVLSLKRDRLKKHVETSTVPESIRNTVSITSCNVGIQIMINSCPIEDGFPLSRLLKAIVEGGFSIINYTCTTANQRLLHTIQSEANGPVFTHISLLEQRLTTLANDY